MATRLKVNKQALLDAAEAALAQARTELEEVKRERKEHDWRPEARKAVEQLTKALDTVKTQKAFRNLMYDLMPKEPNFERQTRSIEWSIREVEDFIAATKMSTMDEISVSTGDEFIARLLRIARRTTA